ncbi:MAG: DNA-processing protein DprA [Bacteroidales bacterium]|jgi:DNA processing protein|nr:DNA-processing protein DprA [Bacteroidales bacterium]
MDDTLKYRIGIGLIPGIGDIMAKKLISYCGGVEAVFREKKETLMKIPGIGETLASSVVLQNILQQAEKEMEFIQRYHIGYAYFLDDNYPQRLRYCPDSPVIFYHKGNVDFNHPKIVSIVGTRQATEYGKDLCNKLVGELKQRNHYPVIVSGLAYGIDVCAHRAALRHGLPTIAVLGHGLSQVYPSAHKVTAHEIVENGGSLLTEFLSNSPIERNNFVKRNRLIAGLADCTVVVESGIKGGALITADIANSYNRDVFAFPGRVTDFCSAGCNHLIKVNKANLIQSVEDIEYLMNWSIEKKKPESVQPQLFPDVSPQEAILLDYLREHGKCTIDQLCLETQMPVNKALTLLLNLELMGCVSSLPGKTYKIV